MRKKYKSNKLKKSFSQLKNIENLANLGRNSKMKAANL